MASHEGGDKIKTFRVWGLPKNASFEESTRILSEIFALGEKKSEPTVHSLGLDPYRFGRSVVRVATVTFANVPEIFLKEKRGRPEWNFQYAPQGVPLFSIMVDTHFLGITPLNCVKDDEEHKFDFIAVSGLSSHPFGSWKQRGGEFMWLRDALARNHEGARILLYGYETDLVKSESFQAIDDIGLNLSQKIQSIRKPQRGGQINFEPRPIVFIAHSLGGLVVQDAIRRMHTKDPVNFLSIYGCLFFGVPSQGILTSHWLPIVQDHPNEGLIRDLSPQSTYLRNLRETFHGVFNFPDSRVFSVFETQKSQTAEKDHSGVWRLTGPTEVLVSRESARASFPPEPEHTYIPFEKNHADLPKFSGEWDQFYREIEECIDEFRQRAVIVIQTRFDNWGIPSRKLQAKSNEELPLSDRPRTPFEDKFQSNKWPNESMHNPGMDYLTSQGPFVNRHGNHSPFPSPPQLSPQGAHTMSPPLGSTRSYDNLRLAQAQAMSQIPGPAPPKYEALAPSQCPEQAEKMGPKFNIEQADEPKSSQKIDSSLGYDIPTFVFEPEIAKPVPKSAAEVTTESGSDNVKRQTMGGSPLCATCKQPFNSHNALLKHYKKTGHGKDEILPEETAETESVASQNTVTLQCRKCKKRFVAKRDLLQHLKASGHQAYINTALHSATVNNNVRGVQILLEQGADIEALEEEGWTPLHQAAYDGDVEVMELLLQLGAIVEARTPDKCTPLLLAVEGGELGTLKLLIERGANVSVKNENGQGPLHLSAENETVDVMKYLLQLGQEVNATDSSRRTALHAAAEAGGIEHVELLLSSGADIVAQDECGLTPSQIATENHHTDVMNLLLKRMGAAAGLPAWLTKDSRGPRAASASLIHCEVCSSSFDSRNQLFRHLRETGHDKGNTPQAQDTGSSRCLTCNWTFSTSDQLANHQDATGHGTQTFSSPPQLTNHQDATGYGKKDVPRANSDLQCRRCNEHFPSRTQLFNHLRATGHDKDVLDVAMEKLSNFNLKKVLSRRT